MAVPRPTPRPAPRPARGPAARGGAPRSGAAPRGNAAQRAAQTRQAVRALQTARARATATDNRMLTALSQERDSHRRAGQGGAAHSSFRSHGNLPVAGFVGLLGGFVGAAGAGSGNGLVAAIGLGMVISGVVYGLFTLARRRLASMVPGTAHIVSASAPPDAATHGRCEMHLVVQAPRLSATAVWHRDPAVPAAKWPIPGGTLPVMVDPRDPRSLKIRWDRARAHGEAVPDQRSDQPAAPHAGRERTETAAGENAYPRTETTQPAPPAPSQAGAPAVEDLSGPTAADSGAAPDPAPGGTSPLSDLFDASDGEPVDLSFLDPPQLGSFLERDPLLVEYGSPIREVGVTLIVSDLKKSLEFYRDVLGFFEIESGPDMVLLEARTGRLVLRQRDDARVGPPRLMHLTLEVNDIDTAFRTLAKRGVEFLDEPRTVLRGEMLQLCAVSFHDPDGHGIALTCWQPRSDDAEPSEDG